MNGKEFMNEKELLVKYLRLKKKCDIMKEALSYCATCARPSIVQDVARNALLGKRINVLDE